MLDNGARNLVWRWRGGWSLTLRATCALLGVDGRVWRCRFCATGVERAEPTWAGNCSGWPMALALECWPTARSCGFRLASSGRGWALEAERLVRAEATLAVLTEYAGYGILAMLGV